MSSHVVEILDHKQLSDGCHAVLARCCGDDIHRSWHTMGPKVILDETKRAASIQAFIGRLMNQHEIALQAEPIAAAMVGTTTVVDVTGGIATVVQTIAPDPKAATA